MNPSARLLKQSPVLRSLPEPDLVALAAALTARKVPKGAVLYRHGDPGDSLILVGQGKLQVAVPGQAGEKAAVSELGPGELLGEMACLDPAPRSATVTAAVDTLVFELSQTTLHALQQHAPQVAVVVVGGIIAQLAARLRETNTRVEHALFRPGRPPLSGVLPRVTRNPAANYDAGYVRVVRPGALPEPEEDLKLADEGRSDAGKLQEPEARPVPYTGPLDLGGLRGARGLSERDLEIFVMAAPPLRYPPGALLCVEGRPAGSCFLIARGEVEVVRLLAGRQRVVATLAPGAFVGQLALVDQGARSATVRAKDEVVALSLARADFDKLLRARSPLAVRFQEQIAIAGIRQLREATERLATLHGAPPTLPLM